MGAVHGSMPAPAEQCLRKALQAVRDVAIGAGPEGVLVLAAFDESAFPAATCVPAVGAKSAPMQDGGEAFELDGALVVHQPGILAIRN